ncbi:MAG: OmpA family protein [Burkholderiales bacterium]|nr:OmpA family protein [Burkholderiales bacterium]
MRTPILALVLALSCLAGMAQAGSPVGTEKRYIACPVYRDTDAGRKSGCWLSTERETGERHDLSNAQNKPWAQRAVLVEGVVSAGKDLCGGVVLEPVRVSVLPQPCPEVIIPAEGYPSKPSGLPAELVLPLEVPRKPPPPPYTVRDFHILFDFGDDFITYQHGDVAVEKVWVYATAAKARQVEVTGHADTRGATVSGQLLAEPAALARARAEMVAEALRRLGVPADLIRLKTVTDPQPALDQPGLREASKRRVTVTVTPGTP